MCKSMKPMFLIYLTIKFALMVDAQTSFYYTDSGHFQNMCAIACKNGYFYSGGSCFPKVYVVQFQVPILLPAASAFNIRKYMASIASLAGVSGCAYTPTAIIPSRIYETVCTSPVAVIKATVDTTSLVLTNSFTDRRLLLTEGTANVVTEIRIESNPTKAAAVQQIVAVDDAVKNQLITDSVGSTVSVIGVTMTIESTVPTSTANTATSATHPKSTSPKSTPRPTSRVITTTSTTSIIQSTSPFPATTQLPPTDTPSPPTTSNSNIGVIIGVSAGAVVLAAAVTIAALFLSMGSKKAKSTPIGNNNNTVKPRFAQSTRNILNLPRGLTSNADLVYVEVPQHLGYVFRYI